MSQPPLLFVDLDNTLTRSDLFLEPLLQLLRREPLALILLPFWLLHGRGYFKQQLADRVTINPGDLPYDEEVLDYLKQQRDAGRKIVLATASNQTFARMIADHLGLFDDVIASSFDINTKGKNKLAMMKHYADGQDFDYLGDSHADIPIWKAIGRAVVVSPQPGVLWRLKQRAIPVELIHEAPGPAVYLQALRPWQWLKNTLVFVPLILAKQLFEPAGLLAVTGTFVSFSLIASAGYLVNDLLDLEADRVHPRKKLRPLASGKLSLWNVVFLVAALLLAGLLLAWLIDGKLALVLSIYFIVTVVYSLELKRHALVDVIMIAGFYAARIIAGGLAASVEISFWLLAFSIFIFLSLALLKRCAEIRNVEHEADTLIPGRGYYKDDELLLSIMGVASGYLAVVVIAFYLNSNEVVSLYGFPQALWLVCPLMLYWISRMWLKTHRDEMHDDPLVFALRDKVSLFTGGLLALVMLMATV